MRRLLVWLAGKDSRVAGKTVRAARGLPLLMRSGCDGRACVNAQDCCETSDCVRRQPAYSRPDNLLRTELHGDRIR